MLEIGNIDSEDDKAMFFSSQGYNTISIGMMILL